ncbi:MAG TPA: winged helix-turn-helix domain-containing protein [Candidatus Pacearchaeota archaeon]|nr:winged helix-turn-helix domain-containing protein [Candidatus Pacearchaeota archaeon]
MINFCTDKSMNVTGLSKKLNLNYSITVKYISMLEKANLITKERNEDRTISVKSLIKINNSGEVGRV